MNSRCVLHVKDQIIMLGQEAECGYTLVINWHTIRLGSVKL